MDRWMPYCSDEGRVSFIENCSLRIIVLWGSGLGHFVASYLFIYYLLILFIIS